MSTTQPTNLSIQQVEHVARLARLELSTQELEQLRPELAAILQHVANLSTLDVRDIEPLAHPTDLANRMDDDVPGPTMLLGELLMNAPAANERYLEVPKVLDDSQNQP